MSPSRPAPRSSQRSGRWAYVALGLACIAGAATFTTYQFTCPWDPRQVTLTGSLTWALWPMVPASLALLLGGTGKVRAEDTRRRPWPAIAALFIASPALLLALHQAALMLVLALAMRDSSTFD
ncbi:hypothetical protein GCM10027089_30070 [Nocardia thraciensis]